MGKIKFENGFFYGGKYFGGWGKVNSQNQKATSPLATTEGVVAKICCWLAENILVAGER